MQESASHVGKTPCAVAFMIANKFLPHYFM